VSPAQARERFAAARHALLATADATGAPHLVPIVFALAGEVIYNAVDRKPKRTTLLRRLANVGENPRVAVLAEHYDEDWTQLWWVRAEGSARILAAGEGEGTEALALLAARYEHYQREPPPGPILAIEVARWSGWAAGES